MEPRKQYTKEFKLDAVSLALDQGLTLAEAARNLGIRAKETLIYLIASTWATKV